MKFLAIKTFLACCALVSIEVQADCTLLISTEKNSGPPVTVNIASELLTMSADLPVDTSTPFKTLKSTEPPHVVSYEYCADNAPFGYTVIGLPGPAGNMYPTNIDGIGIKIRFDNGFGGQRYLPYLGYTPADLVRLVFRKNTLYFVDFFKTAETVKLKPNQINTVLNGGQLAYIWVLNESPASYAQMLEIGNITVVSTPACTFESTKSVDFNTVTPTMADSGVERPLNFEMNCKTDYGSYSVMASIVASARSADGKYIAITDAGGNNDRLKIKINDSEGENIAVDGTSLRKVTSVNNIPAQFKWKATLLSSGPGNKKPTGGQFDARAEIVLQVN